VLRVWGDQVVMAAAREEDSEQAAEEHRHPRHRPCDDPCRAGMRALVVGFKV